MEVQTAVPSFYFPLTVIVLPLPGRPLCPGFYSKVYVKDPKLLADLMGNIYVGVFLLKDDTNSSSEVKGKELLNRLHEIGSLAQILSIQGHNVVITGLTRIRITEMVSEDPLTVKFDHLKDKPYDKDDDVIKATFLEVSSVLRDVLKICSLCRNLVQHIGEFSHPQLADFGAAIPCGRKHQTQQVIQELDVYKRLQLTLELARREMEIIKLEGQAERNCCVVPFLREYKPFSFKQAPVGIAMALSLTTTTYLETILVEKGEGISCLKVNGQIGKETYDSAHTAYMLAQQILLQKQSDNTFFANSLLSLDFLRAQGASAGCTMTTSMLSLAMNKPVKKDLAMTGAIAPSGKILRIGSVKQKTIRARQSKVKTLIFPEANRRDFDELAENLKEGIDVHFVSEYQQIFELAFGYDEEESYFANYVGNAVLYEVGVAMCLATTSKGGLAWYIKTTLDAEDEGIGCLNMMGKLGEGMGESLRIGSDLAEQILLEKQPENTFFADSELSIYFPTCSKNNSLSAGCAITTSFLSLALKKPVRKDLAITGAVTLTGKILGIDNVKEKTIGARRSQVKTIIFPEANRRDFDELAENVKEGLDVHFVHEYEQISS